MLQNKKNLIISIKLHNRERNNRVRFIDSILLEGEGIYHKQHIEETLLCRNQLSFIEI